MAWSDTGIESSTTEQAGLSWSGYNVYGDAKSIAAVKALLHVADRLAYFEQQPIAVLKQDVRIDTTDPWIRLFVRGVEIDRSTDLTRLQSLADRINGSTPSADEIMRRTAQWVSRLYGVKIVFTVDDRKTSRRWTSSRSASRGLPGCQCA